MKIQDRRQTPASNENGRKTNNETEKKSGNYYSTVKWRQSDACVTRSVSNVSNKNPSSDLDTSVPLKHVRGERGLGGDEVVSLLHPWYRSRSGRSVHKRPETVETDPDIMKELLYYRKLLTKGPLLQKENLDLIQTIQKVKRLPASLRTKRDAPVRAEGTLSPRQLQQQLEDSFSAGASSLGGEINCTECKQLNHAVERMKSNEDLLDSFREDFLKSVESNAGMQIRNEENSRFREIDGQEKEDDCDKFMSEDGKLATTGGSNVELNLPSSTDKVSLIPKTEHLTSESEVSSLESIPVDKKSQDLSTAIKRSLSAVSFFENGQAAGLEKRLSLDCSSSLTGFSVDRAISQVVKENRQSWPIYHSEDGQTPSKRTDVPTINPGHYPPSDTQYLSQEAYWSGISNKRFRSRPDDWLAL
ncbi:hypothetical protein BSL78_19148 [Apostichopus japonicus]|uniref:Uncharacterized protein n=1 Tax=Stichopus japonicus TaxID=307972 RepID=A0A2G8K7L8_STIJA|nr:hypothetical protein BSL78_19148 [Apostichopus japonicus]